MKRTITPLFVLALLGACRGTSAPTSTPTYSVEGQVKHAGVRPFDADLTLFEAVSSAEPLQKTCDLQHVRVVRAAGNPPLELVIDLEAMYRTGDSTNNVHIQAGDVIVVPARAGS